MEFNVIYSNGHFRAKSKKRISFFIQHIVIIPKVVSLTVMAISLDALKWAFLKLVEWRSINGYKS